MLHTRRADDFAYNIDGPRPGPTTPSLGEPVDETQMKRRIAFALLMGVVTTGIISFVILGLNLGFTERFVSAWLRSWAIAYVIVIPAILVIGPRLQSQVDRMVR